MFHFVQHDSLNTKKTLCCHPDDRKNLKRCWCLDVSLCSTWQSKHKKNLICHPDRRKDLKRCWCLDVSLHSTWHLYLLVILIAGRISKDGVFSCFTTFNMVSILMLSSWSQEGSQKRLMFRCFTTFNMTDKVQNNLTCHPDRRKDLKRWCF